MFNTPLKLFVTGFKKKYIQRHPIDLTDADYDYILDKIEFREKIEFERILSDNSDNE